MKRVREFFSMLHTHPRSFRSRLTLAFSITAMLPLLAALIAAVLALNRSFETQATNSLISYANLEHQRIDGQLNNIVNTSSVLLTYINSFLLKNGVDKDSSYLSLLNFEQIRSHVRNLQFNNNIQKIRIYSDNIPFTDGDGINFFSMDKLESTGLPQQAYSDKVPLNRLRFIISYNQQSAYVPNTFEDFISFYRVIRNINGEIVAVLFIDCSIKDFIGREEGMVSSVYSSISDEKGAIICQFPQQTNKNLPPLVYSPKKGYTSLNGYIYVQRKFDLIDWTLTLDIPFKDIYRPTLMLLPIYVSTMIISIILCLIFGYYLSNRVTERLYSFFDAINRIDDSNFASNDFITKRLDELTETNSVGDEIDNVMHLVGNLIKRNSTLKDQAANHKIKIERYKLAVLQEQINPHFLYNALDTIRASMLLNKKEIACRLTDDLSRFYRICLSGGKDIITIEQELRMVEHYLQIECVGYDQQITWEISSEDDMLKCLIPKFTLQPLIENSIVHGMESGSDKSINIQISVQLVQDDVAIVIEDNGVGVNPDKLAAINHMLRMPSQSDTGSFGIQNIHNRIQLLFGDSYGVEIGAIPHGFVNRVTIPMEF